MNTSGSTNKRAHHFKTDAAWLADVEQTGKAVRRQNECGKNSPVELAPSEVLELVRLARLALEPSVWQPINTAPQDGRRILLWFRTCKNPSTGYWDVDDMFDQRSPTWVSPEEGWRNDGDACIPRNQDDCTHWMPLPKGPSLGLTKAEK